MTTHGNGESIEYIQNIAIPYFIKMHDYFTATDYYTLLGRHFEKIVSMMNALLMTRAVYGIFKRCFINEGSG